jgi:hypothetical protein
MVPGGDDLRARSPWDYPALLSEASFSMAGVTSAWLGRLVAGEAVVSMMTEISGSSNAKAKRELGWSPRYPSWRDGFPGWAGTRRVAHSFNAG